MEDSDIRRLEHPEDYEVSDNWVTDRVVEMPSKMETLLDNARSYFSRGLSRTKAGFYRISMAATNLLRYFS